MTVEQIRQRLAKLDAMTEVRGATKQEAATARKLAAELRTKLPPDFNQHFQTNPTFETLRGHSASRSRWQRWEEARERQQSYTDWFHEQLKRGNKERDGILRTRRSG